MHPFRSRSRAVMAWPLSILAMTVLLWPAPGGGHGPDGKGSVSFEAYEAGDFPARFKGLRNPLPSNDQHVLAGQTLYQDNCVMCHGANAEGNGHMAQMIDVKPANLRQMLRYFPEADDYYHWIISEGGQRFDLPMPGFQSGLSETQIWQLVTWMQAGFPGAGTVIVDRMHHHHDRMHGGDHMPGHHMGGGGHMPSMPPHGMPQRDPGGSAN